MDGRSAAFASTCGPLLESASDPAEGWPESHIVTATNYVEAAEEEETAPAGDESVTLTGFASDKSRTGGWKAAIFIFVYEFGETIGQFSVALNLVPYLVLELRQSNQKATTIFTNFFGTSFITSLPWGFVADAYLGRYWTVALGTVIMFAGLLLIALSTAVKSLKPAPCEGLPVSSCGPADGTPMAVFYASIYLIAAGAGAIKPCLPPLGGDQFDDSIPAERNSRPAYFNFLFWSVQLGTLIVLTFVVYIQDNVGRTTGYAIPTALFFASAVFFFAGTPYFRHRRPKGSGFTRMAQVFVAAARKFSVSVPQNPTVLYGFQAGSALEPHHTSLMRFLDRAAVITAKDLAEGKGEEVMGRGWRLCSVQQVEETKRVMQVLPIWITTIVPYCVIAQVSSYSVIQSLSMDRHIGPHFEVPYASFGAFALILCSVILPLYGPFVVPALRRLTGHPRGMSPLWRIGTGLVITITPMVSAALVEIKRKEAARREGKLDNPLAQLSISAFWLVPQLGIIGLSEVFLTVGQLEFFYEEMPEGFRSIGTAFYLSAIAVGYFISSFVIDTVTRLTSHGSYQGWLAQNINRGDLQKFYWMLALISSGNLCFFLVAAHFYRYRSRPGAVRNVLDPARNSTASSCRLSDAQLLDQRRFRSSFVDANPLYTWLPENSPTNSPVR